jgi:CheY-like chemotaxis protein
MTHERMECLNSGMDDFVSKPVVRAQLVEVLSKWLGPSVTRRAPG